ncbi:glycoside hydrolase family protein [Maribellus maritimus]|uniref:glycoside hydrolase family protein n=1 Tax=Maribellus maritimus TaxID=2870838 RepID=UPI001EEB51F2|nr:glycoside hydrolase family protein [Maribellus maritimus]MCG6190499.1 glycoside hydrolase family protein [Maribellus maritimus]
MKKIVPIIFILPYAVFVLNSGFVKGQELNIGVMVQPVSKLNKFIDSDYYIWGASVVKGEDGKYHMFYSRWKRELGFYAWVTHSEIAYAVSDNVDGPFEFVNVTLPPRGKEFWDGTTTHNPTILRKDSLYYLYYMGTTGLIEAKQPISMSNKDWWIYRNNQRIGVAVANNPSGPWKRLNKPIIDVSDNPTAYDALMTSNPAVNYTSDERIILIYKAVDKGKNYKSIDLSTDESYKLSTGKKVRFMVAFANNPLGPFKKHSEPIFELKGTENIHMVAEDPYVWHQYNKYYAIVRDVVGTYTGDAGALALMKSENGYDWKPTKHPLVLRSRFEWENGEKSTAQLERPQLLIENGIPRSLYGALSLTVDGVYRDHSCNVRIPLKQKYEELNFQQLLPEELDKSNIIQEEKYNVWGTNIIKGKDGKYHAIYSRWLKSRGHHAWVTHSEVAHAVSDNLTGPYVFKNVVLPARGNEYWDGEMTHNPHLIEYDGKYYLYYNGNKGSGYWATTPDDFMPETDNPEWWVNRNNQRVGVAITDNINGEWKRFDKPLIDISNGRQMTATPVVSLRPDGKFLMAYKYVTVDGSTWGGKVVHVTALSDSPLGPFVDTNIPFITVENKEDDTDVQSKFAIDDHVQWYQDGRYYCIGKDCYQSFSDYPKGSMLLWTSDSSGLNWKLAQAPLVFLSGKIPWTDGDVTTCTRTCDMPKIYMEHGKMKALIMATLPVDSEISFSTIVPLIY